MTETDRSDAVISQETRKIVSNPKLKEEARNHCSLEPSEGVWP